MKRAYAEKEAPKYFDLYYKKFQIALISNKKVNLIITSDFFFKYLL